MSISEMLNLITPGIVYHDKFRLVQESQFHGSMKGSVDRTELESRCGRVYAHMNEFRLSPHFAQFYSKLPTYVFMLGFTHCHVELWMIIRIEKQS